MRKFRGKTYHLFHRYELKFMADGFVKSLQNQGYRARIYVIPDGRWRYWVYCSPTHPMALKVIEAK
jgi:hypothetical protein